MESMDFLLARKTIKKWCCSNCWGELEMRADPRDPQKYFVICKSCGDDTKGYVTKYFADRRRNDSGFEKMEVKQLLKRTGIIDNPLGGLSAEDLLKQLGF